MPEVPTGERVTSLSEGFKPGAPGHQYLEMARLPVIEALQEVFPPFHFVEFVQNQKTRGGEPGSRVYYGSVIGIIVTIERVGSLTRSLPCEIGLANLPGPRQKDHFFGKI